MANTYTNAKVDLTTNSVTTLYTCAASTTAIVKSILVSEDSGNADTITLTLTNGSDVYSLFKTKSISSNGTTELLSAPLVLQATEILKVTAATANRLHVVASILEIT
jgi:pyridoxal/pyridoxine/pyridoxamine kinase